MEEKSKKLFWILFQEYDNHPIISQELPKYFTLKPKGHKNSSSVSFLLLTAYPLDTVFPRERRKLMAISLYSYNICISTLLREEKKHSFIYQLSSKQCLKVQ